MIIDNFNRTINFWISEIERYNFDQLCAKPAPDSWSIGQVCMHLLEDTSFYIDQIKICLQSTNHAKEDASPSGRLMLQNNDFPDEIIEGAASNALVPQPESKPQLLNDMLHLKAEMNRLATLIETTPNQGKAKHPGLNYFSAMEWLQFADMHLRHHLRQKKRIDEFLEVISKIK